jgi:hypothetical protein
MLGINGGSVCRNLYFITKLLQMVLAEKDSEITEFEAASTGLPDLKLPWRRSKASLLI